MRFFLIALLVSLLSLSTVVPVGVSARGNFGMRVMRNSTSTDKQETENREFEKHATATSSSDFHGRCKVVEGKIEEKVGHFDKSKEDHVMAYQNLKNQIVQFIARLNSKGVNTAKLSTDLDVFNTKVVDMAADYATYITALNETKTSPCGSSQGEFKQKLQTARDLLKVVHQDAVEIRAYYRDVIRVDIKALRGEAHDSRSSSTKSSL